MHKAAKRRKSEVYIGKLAILKEKKEFDLVFREGRRQMGRGLSLAYRTRTDGGPRAAFVAGRAVGGAVERNRQRRRLREACRILWPLIRDSSADVVFLAQADIVKASFAELTTEMEKLLRRAGILRHNEKKQDD